MPRVVSGEVQWWMGGVAISTRCDICLLERTHVDCEDMDCWVCR